MWHFGKGQALRLGRPSIFITSPLVIWKLASPIFVSPLSLAAPAILSHILILLLFSLSFFFTNPSLPPPHIFFLWLFSLSCHVSLRRGEAFFLLTQTKLSLLGIGNKISHTHTQKNTCTHAQGLRGAAGVRGPHVNTSCEDCGDREKG